MTTHVQGDAVPPTDAEIAQLTDWARVRKLYKLGALNTAPFGRKEKADLEMSVLGAMALRGL